MEFELLTKDRPTRPKRNKADGDISEHSISSDAVLYRLLTWSQADTTELSKTLKEKGVELKSNQIGFATMCSHSGRRNR